MSKFKELNNYINDILIDLISNDNLTKLLEYNTPDALESPSLKSPESLINKNIFTFNHVPASDKAKSIISVILDDFENNESVYFRKNNIVFNILVHNDLWLLENNDFRVFKIMEEIDNTYNIIHTKNDNFRVHRLEFVRANHLWATNEYSGYTLKYKIWNHA